MKKRIRTITIGTQKLSWVISQRIHSCQAITRLSIFCQQARVIIIFSTWDDPMIGNPLNTGWNVGTPEQPKILNLNHSHLIAEIIHFILEQQLWSLATRKVVILEQGLTILADIGYDITSLKLLD